MKRSRRNLHQEFCVEKVTSHFAAPSKAVAAENVSYLKISTTCFFLDFQIRLVEGPFVRRSLYASVNQLPLTVKR